MKIHCDCGYMIVDQTDYLSYKADYISDQDSEDFLVSIEKHVANMLLAINNPNELIEWRENYFGKSCSKDDSPEKLLGRIIWGLYSKYSRTMYQCVNCGRIYLDDFEGNLNCFTPQETTIPKTLLTSTEGENWRRPLIGYWDSNNEALYKGHLFYGYKEEDYERFENWNDLYSRYFKIFQQLKSTNKLRSSLLRKDNQSIHNWVNE